MITRDLEPYLLKDAQKTPVIAILGPWQSGKTTLARATFKKHTYISFEDIDVRNFALSDPRGFLKEYENEFGIILDEVQHVPSILSYIQTYVDEHYKLGYFILTGSQNFMVMESITQTLAGRISLHTLLPLSAHELTQAGLLPTSLDEMLFKGLYPIIYGRAQSPTEWYGDYIRTYVERDVRTLTSVTDLNAFQRFIKLCAGRIGQLVNLTSLGNDCGISYNTVRAWLSVLEASYILFLLQPHHQNFSKRLIKAPKLFFYDTGLACKLLGIESEDQLASHYLRGGLFESYVISDLYKSFYNADKTPNLYFWRDKTGHEVDCIVERGTQLFPMEIKSGQTINSEFFDGLTYWNNLAQEESYKSVVIYGGLENQQRSAGAVVGWNNIHALFKKITTT